MGGDRRDCVEQVWLVCVQALVNLVYTSTSTCTIDFQGGPGGQYNFKPVGLRHSHYLQHVRYSRHYHKNFIAKSLSLFVEKHNIAL